MRIIRTKKILKRRCSVCGKVLNIEILNREGNFKGGYYFGKFRLYKKNKRTGRFTQLGKMKVAIVKGIGKYNVVEYWECNKCFKNGD